MKWTWKHAAVGYTAVGFAVWLIFYVVEWNIRTGGQVDMSDALLNWLGHLVMLQWVKGYQTLVGAILALIGGASVFGAAWAQRQWALNDAIAGRRDLSLATITRVRIAFQKAYNELTTDYELAERMDPMWVRNRTAQLLRAVDELDQQISAAAHLGSVAELLQFASTNIRDRVRVTQQFSDETHIAAGIAAAVGAYLLDSTRLVGPNGYAEHKPSTQLQQLTAVLSRLRLTTEDFGRRFPALASMFSFAP